MRGDIKCNQIFLISNNLVFDQRGLQKEIFLGEGVWVVCL
jgi:hypothetical protein